MTRNVPSTTMASPDTQQRAPAVEPEAKRLFFAALLMPATAMMTGAPSVAADLWLAAAIPVYFLVRWLPSGPRVIWGLAALGALATSGVLLLGAEPPGGIAVPAARALAFGFGAIGAGAALAPWPGGRFTGLAVATASAAAALTALASGPELWPPGPVLGGRGVPAAVALVLGLALPARAFRSALDRPDPVLRALGLSGLLAVGAWLAMSAVGFALTDACTAALWALGFGVLTGALHDRERERLEEPVRRRHRLTATVICLDEADRIRTCLDSLVGWADEIVVLDSGSSDGTAAIAREYTDRVEVTDWPGYGPQKQRALERATGDWVLSIDADEAVTPDLRHDIDEALSVESPACVAYRLPWAVTVYGKRLDFGRSARAPLRLFRRSGARFSEDLVHETVLLAGGPVGRLRGRLLHFTHRDFGHALEKSARYAWLGAQKKHARNPRAGSLLLATLVAAIRFLHIYLLRLGFLDGPVGYLVAVTYSQGAFNKYAGAWTLRRQARLEDVKPRDTRNDTESS